VVAPGLPPRIAFLGFGLIGGSIATALRAADPSIELAAWTPDGRGPAGGLGLGILDRAAPTPSAALDGAELIVLAGPPLAVLAGLGDLAGMWRDHVRAGATITDVASTKGEIVEAATARGLAFVGGHPMAGREASGVEAATADLFVGRPWVVVPSSGAGEPDVARVEALATAVGARPVRMTADGHDRAVAAISHLPLVVAAALVQVVADGPEWPLARELAATGWADMTRLARGDPEMGAGIVATNAAAVADRLRQLRGALDTWIEALDADSSGPPDAVALRDRFAAARAQLDPGGGR
jgi:prephenate dehydrogenase